MLLRDINDHIQQPPGFRAFGFKDCNRQHIHISWITKTEKAKGNGADVRKHLVSFFNWPR